MNLPIEIVALCHCLHCDGVFVHPAPGPDGLRFEASRYATTKRLVWSDDVELWVCPECETPEWEVYMPPEPPQIAPRLFRLDANKIDWEKLDDEKIRLFLTEDLREIQKLIDYVQDEAIAWGAKNKEEVFF